MGLSETNNSIALALSGGGFRATLFHLGSLIRLNELGILPKLKTISSISGGAITGCYLGLKWRDLDFDENSVAKNLDTLIVKPIRDFCSKDIDTYPSLLNMAIMVFGGTSSALAGQYRKHLYGSSTLQDLPSKNEGPQFVFLGSNLKTGARIWFTRERLTEERLGFIENPEITLATVVAVSSALPPYLSPVIIKTDPDRWKKHDNSKGMDLWNQPNLRRKLILCDGGIHDPVGLDPVIDNHDTIFVSDASVTREVWKTPSSFWIRQTGRSTILQTVSNVEMRKRTIQSMSTDKRIAWWSNDDSIDSYGIENALTCDSDTREQATYRTRLDPFNNTEQGRLINWAYALADASIQKEFPELYSSQSESPIWPIPDVSL